MREAGRKAGQRTYLIVVAVDSMLARGHDLNLLIAIIAAPYILVVFTSRIR